MRKYKLVHIEIRRKSDKVMRFCCEDYEFQNIKQLYGYGDCLFKRFIRFWKWDIVISYR